MYQAKARGKGCHQVFDAAVHSRALTYLQLETDLRHALERQELRVHYQPIVSLTTGKIMGFEALVRWQHSKQGLIPPGEFIPIAEETGLVVAIDLWVLQQACQQLSQWRDEGLLLEPLKMSVNLSVKNFLRSALIQKIDDILHLTGLDSQSLKLEITESAIMDNAETAVSILEQLRARQIHLSIDDFGTGYSSLSYLHQFPVDMLKIDRSFINRIQANGTNIEIVQAIVVLANSLGMQAIAEGIETSYQLDHVQAMGCQFGQGYFFSRPLDASATRTFLQTKPNWSFDRHFQELTLP